MITWAQRAKAAISQTSQGGTAKTDETPVLGVLTVLAVTPPSVFEKSTDWHALDATYLTHHFNCPACIAAGRGERYGFRCSTGAALWRAYTAA